MKGIINHIRAEERAIDEKKIDILLEEYKILKRDGFIHIEFYNRQLNLFHIFIVFILGLFTSYYANILNLQNNTAANAFIELLKSSQFMRAVIILLGFSFSAYYIALIMMSAFKFAALRYRMGDIETQINTHFKCKLMKYEAEMADIIYNRAYFFTYTFAPSFLSIAYRGIIISVLSYSIVYLTFNTLEKTYLLLIGSFLLTNMILIIWISMNFFNKGRIESIIEAEMKNNYRQILNFFSGFTSYFSVFLIFVFFIIIYMQRSDAHTPEYIEVIINNFTKKGGHLQWLYLIIYGIISSLPFSPFPVEASLLLLNKTNNINVFFMPAIGKALDFVFLAFIIQNIVLIIRRVSPRLRRLIVGIRKLIAEFSVRISDSFIFRKLIPDSQISRWLVFLAFQSIPFAPMRSAVVFFALAESRNSASLALIFALSLVGGIVRIWLMSWAIGVGIVFVNWI